MPKIYRGYYYQREVYPFRTSRPLSRQEWSYIAVNNGHLPEEFEGMVEFKMHGWSENHDPMKKDNGVVEVLLTFERSR